MQTFALSELAKKKLSLSVQYCLETGGRFGSGKISMTALAEKVGVHRTSLGAWRDARLAGVDDSTLERWARAAFGMPLSEYWEWLEAEDGFGRLSKRAQYDAIATLRPRKRPPAHSTEALEAQLQELPVSIVTPIILRWLERNLYTKEEDPTMTLSPSASKRLALIARLTAKARHIEVRELVAPFVRSGIDRDLIAHSHPKDLSLSITLNEDRLEELARSLLEVDFSTESLKVPHRSYESWDSLEAEIDNHQACFR